MNRVLSAILAIGFALVVIWLSFKLLGAALKFVGLLVAIFFAVLIYKTARRAIGGGQ